MSQLPDHFDPNAAASEDSGIFGLPHSREQAKLHILPVEWEATTSYGGGTSRGPAAVLEASKQVDLYDLEVLKPYEPGIHMLEADPAIAALNTQTRAAAEKIIAVGGDIGEDRALHQALDEVNQASRKLNDQVLNASRKILKEGKVLALLGGDHSTPFGAIQAQSEKTPGLGILHFDAHSDTRIAYEGFEFSHASIMHNVMERIPGVSKLVQVGIRDFCEQEIDYCRSQGDRIKIHFDGVLARRKMSGETWRQIASKIVADLPQNVWISFDIDGLDPRFCPHTGTPVPGGLDFHEAVHLIGEVARSGRKIVGFDLNEVAPNGADETDEWDANVGARLLYKLCAWTFASQGLCELNPIGNAT
jgi:agmatinase